MLDRRHNLLRGRAGEHLSIDSGGEHAIAYVTAPRRFMPATTARDDGNLGRVMCLRVDDFVGRIKGKKIIPCHQRLETLDDNAFGVAEEVLGRHACCGNTDNMKWERRMNVSVPDKKMGFTLAEEYSHLRPSYLMGMEAATRTPPQNGAPPRTTGRSRTWSGTPPLTTRCEWGSCDGGVCTVGT